MGKTIRERDSATIWHPYTQMLEHPEAIAIVKGEGIYLHDEDGNRYMDASSSWWVNLHGHAHPYIAQKVSAQLTELEHCIFAGFTHLPAVELAENLLSILPSDIRRIFYSDNGSTAVEVALKMAIQYWINKGERNKKKIIAIEHAYHGDTFATMAVSGRSLFTNAFSEFLFDVEFIPFPEGHGEKSIHRLEQLLQQGDIAALIVEPLVQGSAGMLMYEPAILERYIELCKQYNCLSIADEVFTGFGRTGELFAIDHITVQPDLVCLSKGLTGGTLAMGITACTDEIYRAFLSHDPGKTLYHGHSYTANPLACAAANASFELLMKVSCQDAIRRIAYLQQQFIQKVSAHPMTEDARCCGTIAAVTVKTANETSYTNEIRKQLYARFLGKGILMRPLGNIIYTLPPYCITEDELTFIHNSIFEALNELI